MRISTATHVLPAMLFACALLAHTSVAAQGKETKLEPEGEITDIDPAAMDEEKEIRITTGPESFKLETTTRDLWIHIRGNSRCRMDFCYKSNQIDTEVWLTDGKNGPEVVADELSASFGSPCASNSKTWLNESHAAFRYFAKNDNCGGWFCCPGTICFIGCAKVEGASGCAKTSDCAAIEAGKACEVIGGSTESVLDKH